MKLDDGRLLRLKPQNLALAEGAVISPTPAAVPRTSSPSVAPEAEEVGARRGSLSSRLALFERKETPQPTRMRRTHSFSGSSALPFFGDRRDKSVERDRSVEREKGADPSPLIKAKTAMFERKEEVKEEPRGRVHGTGDNIYKRWMTDKVCLDHNSPFPKSYSSI